jgi:hypothetical protein
MGHKIEVGRIARLQSRPDETADKHVLKRHFGRVLLPRLNGTCSRPDAAYL